MNAPVLQASAVSVTFARSGTVVRGVDLDVAAGDAIGIAGESGSGKTTLSRVMTGQITPTRGSALVHGRSWAQVPRRSPHRRAVQMIFQDTYSALNPRLSARSAVAEAVRVVAGVPRKKAHRRAVELLEQVGLSGRMIEVRPSRLSGGQRQRVVIARALACEPDVIVADEPTSSLDVSVQAQILELLRRLRTDRGVALVLVTHDLSVLKHMTDTCLVMRSGEVVETGPTERVLERPAHPYTRELVATPEVA